MATAPHPQQKKLPFWPGVLAIALGVPAIFWLKFGVVDGVALGLTGFLLLLVFAIEFVPKLNDEYGAELEAKKVEPLWIDRLGVVWLLAIPFSPFVSWVVKALWTVDETNWHWVLGVRSFFCVVLPCASVLPLLRYVRGHAAPYALLILFLGTAFPISAGYDSLLDLCRGPTWETVDITHLERVYISVDSHPTRTSTVHVALADGRNLDSSSDVVTLHEGPTRALIFEALGLVIARQ